MSVSVGIMYEANKVELSLVGCIVLNYVVSVELSTLFSVMELI